MEVFGFEWADEVPASERAAPWSCRLSLWHRWVLVRLDPRTSYVECERCHRFPTPSIFDPPAP